MPGRACSSPTLSSGERASDRRVRNGFRQELLNYRSLVISLYFDYAKCWRIEKESGDRAIADALGSSDVFDDDESRRMKKSKRTVEKAISLGSI